MNNREERIKEIAYRLWEQEGRPEGHSERLWLAAEAQYEADNARAQYETEVAKDRGEPPGKKPARLDKRKEDEPPAEMPPPPSAMTKTAEAPSEKTPRAVKAKTPEPAAKKPVELGKRRPSGK